MYFISKLTDIGIYKIDDTEYQFNTPVWLSSEQDCFFTDKHVLYHGTSVWRVKIDRLEFYVSIKEIQKWTP